MKKSTLIILLINVLDNISEYCEKYCVCEAAKSNLEFVIEKIKKEEIENDS